MLQGCLYPPLEGANRIKAMNRYGAGGGHNTMNRFGAGKDLSLIYV